ncbi:Pyridine nucleotide-disulfide oxidoreductase [Lotmaria passim]
MGQQGSRIASAIASGNNSNGNAEEDNKPIDLTDRLSLAAPNAAVIGAGVAGVHVAYELAKIGFKVTVFERRNDIAGGETRYSLPFVGVGLVEPALVRASLRSEIFRGMLFPAACPDLIAREHLFHSVMNPVVYRWMWGRLRSCFTDQEVMCYTNNLSRVSHTVVRDLVNKYPQLQEHVFTGPVTVLNEKREVATTAHGEPFMVDPVGWTRAMAEVCRTHFGVEFALGERLEDTHTYLKYDVESMRSIRVSKPDTLNPEQRVYASERYDVVVLAAGSSTGTVTLPNSRLPILGLSGLSAVVRQPTDGLKDALWTMFQRKPTPQSSGAAQNSSDAAAATSLSRPAPGTLTLLSSKCSLYAYTWPSVTSSHADASGVASMVQSKVMPTVQDYVLQGLLSLDNTLKPQSDSLVMKQLQRLESYMRVKCGATVPLHSSVLAETETEEAHAGGTESSHNNRVHVSEYVRAFTPDGVPLVDHNGGAFNCFVCSGFGDHAMDFAPGAAKVLGKLVEHQAQRLREEDIDKARTWGVLTSKLTPSRRVEVEAELQSLLNGVVPREEQSGQQGGRSTVTASRAKLATSADVATEKKGEEQMLHFEMNPFSTNRFQGLVQKEVKNVTSPSWLEQFYQLEDRFQLHLEPYRLAFHRKLVKLAEKDNVPDALRTIVFCYFYDENDDPEAVARKLQVQDGVRKLAEKYETPAAVASGATSETIGATLRQPADDSASLTPAERSKRKQAEMERQARELFTKP